MWGSVALGLEGCQRLGHLMGRQLAGYLLVNVDIDDGERYAQLPQQFAPTWGLGS